MRTFICIDFPLEIEKEIERLQKILLKKKFTGKLTEPETLHLTLKFLGELSPEEVEKVKAKLKEIKFPVLNLKLDHLGTFNHQGNPRIVWLKLIGANKLQNQIDIALKDRFLIENRFMSHLTLARVKYVKDKSGFIDYVKQIKPMKLKFQASSFKLKESTLSPQGPEYKLIEEYSLL